MTTATTLFHIADRDPASVEDALARIFTDEGRHQVLRLEGTFSAVLARVTDPDLDALFRYLILRPRDGSRWTTVVELGNRTDGLEVELSRILGGTPVFALFIYGEDISGYRLARDGALVDHYLSDPEYLASIGSEEEADQVDAADDDSARGHPERFADLLPTGTTPAEFTRVVLRPGYWETRDAQAPTTQPASASASAGTEPAATDGDDEGTVDEVDRLRCIGLALEVWHPETYPFAWDLEEISNGEAGPAIVLAFA